VTLEKQAYTAIAEEEERLRVLNNAKSEKNRQKRLQQYDSAPTNTVRNAWSTVTY